MKWYPLFFVIFLGLTIFSYVRADELGSYIVRAGDTFSNIALKCNTTVHALAAANSNIKKPDLIHPNEVIKLPSGAVCK